MKQLVYRIKDIEAHPKGVEVDQRLSPQFLTQALGQVDLNPERSFAQIHARLIFQGGQGSNVLCHGELSGALVAECQRCLAPATLPISTPLHLTFVPAGAPTPGHDRLPEDPFDPDDVDYAHHDRETLDLGQVVREYLVLSLPMTILCREDCLGLCPSCGQDRNQGPCPCQPVAPMSPFAVLKDLKAH